MMLDQAKCCLVIIDVQGKLARLVHDKERLINNIGILIKIAKALEFSVIRCEQNPKALGATVEELEELLGGNKPIAKFSFSCCGNDDFNSALAEVGRGQVILCGIEGHVCVYQTAIEMLEKGLEVYVVADAVSSRTKENKDISLQRMASEGVKLCSTEMLMFELLKTSKHEKFKELARLIK